MHGTDNNCHIAFVIEHGRYARKAVTSIQDKDKGKAYCLKR